MSLIKIHSRLKRFCGNCQGIAATEFALAAPLLITLCLGGFELARYSLLNLKVEKVAFTIADVVAQNENLTISQIDDIFEAAEQILDPFPFDSEGIVYVSSVYRAEGDTYPDVIWQHSGAGTASYTSQVGSVGLTATLPNSLTINERDNVIVSEVYYDYDPIFSLGLISSATIYKTTVFKPRLGDLTTTPT